MREPVIATDGSFGNRLSKAALGVGAVLLLTFLPNVLVFEIAGIEGYFPRSHVGLIFETGVGGILTISYVWLIGCALGVLNRESWVPMAFAVSAGTAITWLVIVVLAMAIPDQPGDAVSLLLIYFCLAAFNTLVITLGAWFGAKHVSSDRPKSIAVCILALILVIVPLVTPRPSVAMLGGKKIVIPGMRIKPTPPAAPRAGQNPETSPHHDP